MAAVDFATQPGLAPDLLNDALQGWSDRRPQDAFRWARENLTAAQVGQVVHQEKMPRRWAQSDPLATSEWLMEKAPEKSRSVAMMSVIDAWSAIDPAPASEFFSGIPAGQVRDSGVYSLISNILSDDPDGALRWSETIGDAYMRAAIENKFANRELLLPQP